MKLYTLVDLHKYKDKLLEFTFLPISKVLNRIGILPNHITILSVFIALWGITSLFHSQLIFTICFGIHLLLDLFDGYYARKFKLQSRTGEILDHGGDMITIFFSLFLVFLYSNNIFILALLFIYAFEFLFLYSTGLFSKKFPSRLFLYFAMFGYLEIGLMLQFVYEPVSLFLVSYKSYLEEKY